MRRAKHNLSHYRVTAGDFGQLYPFSCTEVLPGDTFRMASSALLRLQPLMTPLMHPVRISIAHFFVPNRLVWTGWESYITGRTPGNIPTVTMGAEDTIADYMGVGVGAGAINAMPIRAFNLIYNEYYRDQDITAERATEDQSVPNVIWAKDYFTTARTAPQQGSQVTIPLSGTGFVKPNANQVLDQTLTLAANSTGYKSNDGNNDAQMFVQLNEGNVNIEDWRKAMAVQKYREARNKFGSRYKDYLAYLGVNSRDSRLDRPEYLGGGRQTIAFSEVLSTTETNEVPLGTQGGHGIASIRTRPLRRMFTEHGHVLSMVHVRPTNMYGNAVDRNWLRTDKDTYWQKENEMLGEQEVLNKEIYAAAADNVGVFGYSPRHDDYRTQRSYATGPMRRSAYNTWHMAREFTSQPGLNDEFLNCKPTDRVFRSQNDPQFYMMIQNRIVARRLVPKYARN